MTESTATAETHGGHAYWRCRTAEHLWVEKVDAEHCCDPGFSRMMVSRGEAVGMHHTKSGKDGLVWVWMAVGR